MWLRLLQALAYSGWRMPDGVEIPRRGEGWVVWNYDALGPAPGAKTAPGVSPKGLSSSLLGRFFDQMQLTGVSVHLLSPEMIKWQVKGPVFFISRLKLPQL